MTLILYGCLEVVQRVRVAHRRGAYKWLAYGFYTEPKIYEPRQGYYKFNSPLDPDRAKKVFQVEPKYVSINQHGLRGAEIADPKTGLRIVVMGGSSTFGVGARDDETFPFLVEKVLREKHRGLSLEVVNAGIPGFDSSHILSMLEVEIVGLSPDILLLYIGLNDWGIISRVSGDSLSVLRRVHDFAMGHSMLYLSLQEKVQKSMTGDIHNLYQAEKLPIEKRAEETLHNQANWERFRNNLRRIAEVCQRNRIRLILATEAVDLQPSETAKEAWYDKELWGPVYLKGRKIVNAAAAENGLALVDAAEAFDRMDRTGLFLDLVHLSAEGNEKLARILADGLNPYVAEYALSN